MPQTEVYLYKEADGTVPLKVWLDELEAAKANLYAKCVDRILELARLGFEMRRPHADILRDGIYELRIKEKKVHFRILYFFEGKNVVVLTHSFPKKGKVPEIEIDRAIENRRSVKKNPRKHIAEMDG